MKLVVERTCTEITDAEESGTTDVGKQFGAWSSCPGIVLLGGPGAGKTTVFRNEAEKANDGEYVVARDFLTLDRESEWKDRTLFIDGLDEVQAGALDRRTPFDAIRRKLDKLGKPRFRLSCREADWFGPHDRLHLEAVTRTGKVKVLRLDPLSDDAVTQLLYAISADGNLDVPVFRGKAAEHGVEALVFNPLNLELIFRVVSDGGWPTTRGKTLESACKLLAREFNDEHVQGNAAAGPGHTSVLEEAGRLCAVQLLSGIAGYALQPGCHDEAWPELSGAIGALPKDALWAIRSRLFEVRSNHAKPYHRSIAEFLGGRWLAGKIADGVWPTRILALLVSPIDGRPPMPLRGLFAWLAAHAAGPLRRDLIRRDPIGVALYGDVRDFATFDKIQLLDSIERTADRDSKFLEQIHDLIERWGDIATPDMSANFRKRLEDTSRCKGKQAVAFAILTAMRSGVVMPELTPVLAGIVRDADRWTSVRRRALDAWLEQPDWNVEQAMNLLTDIWNGVVPDSEDEFLGRLLSKLYPQHLSGDEVVAHLRTPKSEHFYGRYQHFWLQEMCERSSIDQLGEALDALADRQQSHRAMSGATPYLLRRVNALLLDRILIQTSDIDDERLYRWLGLVSKKSCQAEYGRISSWLAKHPELFKNIFRQSLIHEKLNSTARERVLDADPPGDFGRWALNEAILSPFERVALLFVDEVHTCLRSGKGSDGLTDGLVRERLEEKPKLLARHARNVQNTQRFDADRAETSRSQKQQRQKKREIFRDAVAAHADHLRKNAGSPQVLDQLAQIYFGLADTVEGDTPRRRLADWLPDADWLVDTAINALRQTPFRADLPDDDELERLAHQGRNHPLSLAMLAGLEELRDPSPGSSPLDDSGMRRAVAMLADANEPINRQPEWFRAVLQVKPGVVAEWLLRSLTNHYLSKRRYEPMLLYGDSEYTQVYRLSVPAALHKFPPRAQQRLLPVLRTLLLAAREHCEQDELIPIVTAKLAIKSMTAAQRMYWLGTGLLVSPHRFADRLPTFLHGRGGEQRITYLTEFFSARGPVVVPSGLSEEALGLLIECVGKAHGPPWEQSGVLCVGPGELAGELVRKLIDCLAARPSREAHAHLGQLVRNDALLAWGPTLQVAAARQRASVREASFRQLSPMEVAAVLDEASPVNPADLAAMTEDWLRDYGRLAREGLP